MRDQKMTGLFALAATAAFVLSGCGTVDESYLNTEANYSVEINMPYATATPLPDYLNVPEAIVIDNDGNVTLNDAAAIEGDFRSAREQEEQTEYRSLSLGSNGIAVQALQARLQELGYYEGEVSGLYDIDTETAIKRFEQSYGTMQTGVATAKLQLRLFAATAPVYKSDAYNDAVVSQYTVLRPGTVGSSVYALQQRLKNLDYPITDLTGAYDAQTARCVQLFYQSYGVAASDIADVDMQRELYGENAHVYDPSIEAMATVPPVAQLDDGAMSLPDDADAGQKLDIPGDADTGIMPGNSGAQVTQLQQRLIELGYMAQGSETGVFDEATQAAVNRFLQAVGRAPEGTLTEEMQAFLLSDQAPTFGGETVESKYENLNPGDSGNAVLKLQRRLVQLGYANGNPNGQYGNATISAVQLFQQANGLDVDGLASAWLQAMLFGKDCPTYAQTQGLEETRPVTQTLAEPTPAPTEAPARDDNGGALFFNLTVGSSGSAVMELQQRLRELGYSVMPTGSYTEATRDAVMEFQNAIGVEATGDASASLQRYVQCLAAPGPKVRFYDRTQSFEKLMSGDSGDGVTALQKQLNKLGYLKQSAVKNSAGVYDVATTEAVRQAQEAMGYRDADGVAGPEFQSFLFCKYSKKIKK